MKISAMTIISMHQDKCKDWLKCYQEGLLTAAELDRLIQRSVIRTVRYVIQYGNIRELTGRQWGLDRSAEIYAR